MLLCDKSTFAVAIKAKLRSLFLLLTILVGGLIIFVLEVGVQMWWGAVGFMDVNVRIRRYVGDE
jgi:hypothetical protein